MCVQHAGTFHSSIVKRLCRGVCFAPQISLPQYTEEKARGAAIAPARTPQAQTASRLRHLPTLRRAMENNAWFVHREIRKRRTRQRAAHFTALSRKGSAPQISFPLLFMQRQIVLHRIPDPRQSIEHRPLPASNALNGAGCYAAPAESRAKISAFLFPT